MQRAYKPVFNMVEMTDVTLQMPRFNGIRTQALHKTDTMLYHPGAEVLVEADKFYTKSHRWMNQLKQCP